jgi:hypothetical protein
MQVASRALFRHLAAHTLHCSVVVSPLDVKDASDADDRKENRWKWNEDFLTAATKFLRNCNQEKQLLL